MDPSSSKSLDVPSSRGQNVFLSQMWKIGGQAANSFLQSPAVNSFIRKQENDSSDDDTSQAEVLSAVILF